MLSRVALCLLAQHLRRRANACGAIGPSIAIDLNINEDGCPNLVRHKFRKSMSSIHLYSYQACPFARRTRMVLLEKGLDFELTEIDIRNKPADFASISPYGKVPVLLHAGGRVYESAIINEYLDEAFPEPALMPADPMQRAQARIWMEYCGSRFAKASWSHMQAGDDPDKLAAANVELHDCLRFMESEGMQKLSDGPYWLGDSVSLLDIQYMPFFQRYLDHELRDIPAECERLLHWLNVMSQRDSFVNTAAQQASPQTVE